MADIRLAKPAAGASESVQCAPEARFVFDFPTTDATLARDGDNLTISFEDGSRLQLEGFYQEYNGENLPSFNIDGTEVAAADFFAAMNEPDLMPAAGPTTGTVANGARFHEWGDSSLSAGITHLDGLDWNFSRAFEWDDVPNAVGRNGDDWGWLGASGNDSGSGADAEPGNNPVTLTPEHPGPLPPDTPEIPVEGIEPGNVDPAAPSDIRVISESGLRSGEPVSVNGAMRVSSPDGVASIEVAGHTLWANGALLAPERIPTDEGYFHNFAYDAASGRLTYTFTLTEATQEHGQPGADAIAHSLPVVVRDADGDAAYGRLTIVVQDDVPEISVTPAHAATAVFGADDTLAAGSLRALEVSFKGDSQEEGPEVNADNTVVWTMNGETLTNIDALAEGESAISGGLMVTRTGDTFQFAFVSEEPTAGTNYGLELKITDADGDVSTATLTMTVPKVITSTSGEGDAQPYAATIIMDEGDNPEHPAARSEDGKHPTDEGSGSFAVDLNGENGSILVGEEGAGYRITIAADGNHSIETLGTGLAAVHGITVTLDTDAAKTLSYDEATGNWTVNFSYARSEAQTHKTEAGEPIGKLAGDIPLTVTDASGNTANADIHVELHDDLTVFTSEKHDGAVELSAAKNFSHTFTNETNTFDDTGFITDEKNSSYWQQSGGGVNGTKNDHPSHLKGNGTDVNFNMTASFVHYQYEVDDAGHLIVTNVIDISSSAANSGKAFAVGTEGLGMGSGRSDPWNVHDDATKGEFSTGAALKGNAELATKWGTAQANMMKDAYGEAFNTSDALSAANVAEAVVFDLNDIAYGIELDLGSFAAGDRVLVTFLSTAPYSDDNHIEKMVEIAFGKENPLVKDLGNGVYRIEMPDGFTKAIVSAVGSSTYNLTDDNGLKAQLADDAQPETSGFSLKGVEFLTPQWTQSGTVEAASADEGIVYGWDFSDFPESVEVRGYYAGTYDLDIQPVKDVPGKWQAMMTRGPAGNKYDGQPLFTFSIDPETGEWTYTQLHEFSVQEDGASVNPPFVITATDADGDVAYLPLDLNGEFVRFDEVRQGHYESSYGTDPSNDKADDVLLGADGDSLLYGKGGDDLVLGDRMAQEGADSADAAVKDIVDDIAGQSKDSWATHNGATTADQLHAKLDNLSPDQLGELSSALEAREDKGGDDLIYGGVGNDILLGMKGDDALYGEKGDDYLFGGSGNDYLDGGAGKDTLVGGTGDDILVGGSGGLELAPALNANFAFLVDVSNGNDVDAAKEQLALLFNQMRDRYADADANVNILLMGFHSYATETVSVDIADPNAWDKLMEGLKNIDNFKEIKGADYTKKLSNKTYIDDPEKENLNELSVSGSNQELAFNYAEGWFHQVGNENSFNQTFLLSSQQASAHLYTEGAPNPNSFFYANSAGTVKSITLTALANNCDGVEYENGSLLFTKFNLGEEFLIQNQSTGEIYAKVNADGLVETYYQWLNTNTKEGTTVRKNAGEPLVETERLPGGSATNKPLALHFDGHTWVLAAVTGQVGTDKLFSANETSQEHSGNALGSLADTSTDVTFVGAAADGYEGVDNAALDAGQMLGSLPAAFHDTLLGGDGNDVLFGDDLPTNLLDGVAAADRADYIREHHQEFAEASSGGSGNDYLDGGAGKDILFGGAGNDELHGGEGDDMLFGGAGNDVLYGEAGNDYLDGGAGRDYLYGGEGNDLIVYDPTDYLIDGGSDIDVLLAGRDVSDTLADMTSSKQVNDVEVLIKGADALDITSMDDLAAKLGVHINGNSMTLDKGWSLKEGTGVEGKNAVFENGDVTLETNLDTITANNTNAEAEQAAYTLSNSQG